MILCDKTLRELILKGELGIDPLGENAIQPASIDLRLGNHFLILDDHRMDIIRMDGESTYREIVADSITIPPHSFVLATTVEYVRVPAYLTMAVEGRSSVGRLGLFIQNAGWIDPGFEGNITLELYNANSLSIVLQAGRRICQAVTQKLDFPSERPYTGKYKGQKNTTGSRIFKDKEITHDEKSST